MLWLGDALLLISLNQSNSLVAWTITFLSRMKQGEYRETVATLAVPVTKGTDLSNMAVDSGNFVSTQ